MVLLGFGAGMAFNPLLLAAMGDVAPEESGLASGIVNTAFMMGGALGLSVLASIAASRTKSLLASGDHQLAALTSGYHLAFVAGTGFAAAAALIGAGLLRSHALPGAADEHVLEELPGTAPGAPVDVTGNALLEAETGVD